MQGINEHTIRGAVELLKFIGIVMAPIVAGGTIAFFFEKPRENETGNGHDRLERGHLNKNENKPESNHDHVQTLCRQQTQNPRKHVE